MFKIWTVKPVWRVHCQYYLHSLLHQEASQSALPTITSRKSSNNTTGLWRRDMVSHQPCLGKNRTRRKCWESISDNFVRRTCKTLHCRIEPEFSCALRGLWDLTTYSAVVSTVVMVDRRVWLQDQHSLLTSLSGPLTALARFGMRKARKSSDFGETVGFSWVRVERSSGH